jgi:hypothetical protein
MINQKKYALCNEIRAIIIIYIYIIKLSILRTCYTDTHKHVKRKNTIHIVNYNYIYIH